MEDADWWSEEFLGIVRIWLEKLLTANELIFAEYCEIHACWKREI